MLRCCLGAYGCPDHAWMPSLGARLMRLPQAHINKAVSDSFLHPMIIHPHRFVSSRNHTMSSPSRRLFIVAKHYYGFRPIMHR